MEQITPRQRDFAVALLTERLVTLQAASVEEAVQRLHLDSLTKADARTVIDRLLKLPVDPDPTMPTVVQQAQRKGTNARPGTCTTCRGVVQAGAGFYYKTDRGFAEHHKVGECTVAAPEVELEAGIYTVEGLGTVLVYMTRNQRLAGKVLQARRFVYMAGAVMQVRAGLAAGTAHRITAQEAREYGYNHSHCIACGLDLTDPRSDPAQGGAGYGPICARKYSWPWG